MAFPELHIIVYCTVLLVNCMFPLNTYSLGQPSFFPELNSAFALYVACFRKQRHHHSIEMILNLNIQNVSSFSSSVPS